MNTIDPNARYIGCALTIEEAEKLTRILTIFDNGHVTDDLTEFARQYKAGLRQQIDSGVTFSAEGIVDAVLASVKPELPEEFSLQEKDIKVEKDDNWITLTHTPTNRVYTALRMANVDDFVTYENAKVFLTQEVRDHLEQTGGVDPLDGTRYNVE